MTRVGDDPRLEGARQLRAMIDRLEGYRDGWSIALEADATADGGLRAVVRRTDLGSGWPVVRVCYLDDRLVGWVERDIAKTEAGERAKWKDGSVRRIPETHVASWVSRVLETNSEQKTDNEYFGQGDIEVATTVAFLDGDVPVERLRHVTCPQCRQELLDILPPEGRSLTLCDTPGQGFVARVFFRDVEFFARVLNRDDLVTLIDLVGANLEWCDDDLLEVAG